VFKQFQPTPLSSPAETVSQSRKMQNCHSD
jgi:hypothetical protein